MNSRAEYLRAEALWLNTKPIEFQRFYKYLQACYLLHRLPLAEKGEQCLDLGAITRCLLEQEYDLVAMYDRGADFLSLFFLGDVYLDPGTADKIIKNYESFMGWEE